MRRSSLLAVLLALLAITFGSIIAPRTADAGGGCHEPSTDVRGTEVDLKELCIVPTVIRAGVGQTITWVNRDAMPHTVTGAGIRSGDGNGWGSLDNIEQGQTFSHAFDRAGVYPYFCWLHPGMVGAVVVGDANAAAFPATMGGALPPVPVLPPTATQSGAALASRPAIAALALAAIVVAAGASLGARSFARRRGARS